MKKNILLVLGICFTFFACQTEQFESQEDNLLENSSKSGLNYTECIVIDADRAPYGSQQPSSNFWWSELADGTDYFNADTYFSSTASDGLVFREYNDGTANILGTTVSGTCVVTVDVWLKDKKTWTEWSDLGGEHKKEGTAGNASNSEDMNFYVIDSVRSSLSASGDCVQPGDFGLEQRPDPNDTSTPNFGAHIGVGGANYDSDLDAVGLSTWGWLTDVTTGERLWLIDFNFKIECPEVVCDECDGKVTELELQYNGDQAANITVETKKKGENDSKIVYNQMVQPGDTFSFLGNDKKGTLGTEISIYIDGVLNTKIHTSCSKPIGPGLVSGDFEVVSGSSRNGGELCPVDTPPNSGDCDECDGKVTMLELQYDGTQAADIVVKTKKTGENGSKVVFDGTVQAGATFSFVGNDKKDTLGTEISIYIDGVLNTKIHTSCSVPIGPGLISGDFTVVSGSSRNGGDLCPIDTPPNSGDCGECDGKINALDMQYNGTIAADIVVKTKKNGEDGSKIVFDGNVQPGATFSFVGNDNKGTLGTEITIYVNGVVNTKIHTSCSVAIGPGLISGDFTLVSGSSRNGGELCPVEPSPVECDCDGKIVEMIVIYDGPNDATVTIGSEDDGSNALQTFNNVQNGDVLIGTIGDVGNWWYWSVNGNLQASIHTSCSDDILGNVDADKSNFGSLGNYPNPDAGDNINNGTFLVISHTDENGNVCSIGG